MTEFEVLPGETCEELGWGDLVLFQAKKGFRFGTDAVLLADFAAACPSERTLDLCCGNGIVPMLLSHNTAAKKIFGLEIQRDAYEMSQRSVAANRLEDRVELVCGDLREADKIFPRRSFSLVTCNPPYMKPGGAKLSEYSAKMIARHEIMCTLDDVVRAAAALLADGGHFCMVHRPARLVDIFCTMRKYEIEPKRMRLVLPRAGKKPMLVLIDGLWRGGCELAVLPPLVLYNEDGSETDEVKKIYERS